MKTKTNKVAREVINNTGKGTIVFNDKLKNGDRSLKVWHWQKPQYELAKELLEQQGCKVKMIEFTTQGHYRAGQHQQIRLHVTEV